MSDKSILPEPTQIARLLTNTLAKTVDVSVAPRGVRAPGSVIAVYKNHEGVPVAAVACEISVAASLGAALVLIPANTAKEAAAGGSLPDTIYETMYEVFNICAQLLRADKTHRMSLDRVYVPGDDIPEDVAAVFKDKEHRAHIHVSVDGYESGLVTMGVFALQSA